MSEQLTPQQMESFHSALLSAFNKNSMARLLRFKFGKSLDHIASTNASLNEIFFSVIETAESEGWLTDFIRQAHQAVPGNPQLKAFVASLNQEDEKAASAQSQTENQSPTPGGAVSGPDLMRLMVEKMSLGDIQIMSFDLGIDYEQFPGGKNVKILEIIQFLERRNRFDELVGYLQSKYPHVFD